MPRMKILETASLLLLIALTTTFNTKAKDKDGKKDHDDNEHVQAARPPGHVYVITEHERQVIHECIEQSYAVSPRGKDHHHHHQFPPGIAKKTAHPA